MEAPNPTPSRGYCIDCNYALQGLNPDPSSDGHSRFRCPECGRAFDPADPKSFRLLSHHPLTRWLARPIGWPLVFVGLAAMGGVLLVSRWNITSWHPSGVDLRFYLRPSALRSRANLMTWRDWIFTLGMLLGIVTAGWWLLRTVASLLARWRMNWQRERPVHEGRRHALLAIGVMITSAAAALGWPYRLAQHWIAMRRSSQGKFIPSTLSTPPLSLSVQQTQATLRAAVMEMPEVQQRMLGLQLLVEEYPKSALPILMEAVGHEPDAGMRATEILLIGMHRDLKTSDLLWDLLDSADARTRAASIDALGLLYAPAFDIPQANPTFDGIHRAVYLECAGVQIDVWKLLDTIWPYVAPPLPFVSHSALRPGDEKVPIRVRNRWIEFMLHGDTNEERQAAARAMLPWPGEGYGLRVAEWGVWISDGAKLELVQSVLDEIPPFVHRTGNPVGEFEDRVNEIVIVTKPIIHITVNHPMAVDISVIINRGRPWFAYPLPDDFSVHVDMLQCRSLSCYHGAPILLAPLDSTQFGKWDDLRQGYPWIAPHHPNDGYCHGEGSPFNELTGLGLRWQSVIASPGQFSWMKLPDTPHQTKYAWWKQLRDVPSAWLSSRGESERFLYYDGPTLAPAPLAAGLTGNQLHLALSIESSAPWRTEPTFYPHDSHPPQAILLIHHNGIELTGQQIEQPQANGWNNGVTLQLPEDDLHGDGVVDAFRKLLQDAGLTAAEAQGLILSWQGQFFQTKGRRLLVIMARADYDALCPMTIRPTPTELVRVGIVLTEFG